MCSQFWPSESVHSTEFGQFTVTLAETLPKLDWEMNTLQISEKNRVCLGSLTLRVFSVLHYMQCIIVMHRNKVNIPAHSFAQTSASPFDVTLFHFLSWPREGCPPVDSLLKMMGEVENKQKESKTPLMVMCE